MLAADPVAAAPVVAPVLDVAVLPAGAEVEAVPLTGVVDVAMVPLLTGVAVVAMPLPAAAGAVVELDGLGVVTGRGAPA